MRAALVLSLVLLAGCASPGGAPVDRNTETVRVADGGTGGIGTSSLQDVHTGTVRASLSDVWRVLPAVYDSLGIPLTMRDQATMQIGNGGFEVRRLLGGTIVSRLFHCGDTSTGSSALNYDLFVSVATQIRPDAAGETLLSTTTNVRAKPISLSGNWIRCESLGLLEQRIVDGVAKQLSR